MFVVVSDSASHFLREWAAAVKRYEEADREFQRITATYMAQVDAERSARKLSGRRQGLSMVEATHLARQDPYRKDAASARQHFADRAMMYGISALVEMLRTDQDESA